MNFGSFGKHNSLTDKELISQLVEQVSFLAKRVGELEERLARYENPKNSRNSSVPPSRDENRPKKNQSLRKATGRKPGGQPGSKGNTLKMTARPDRIVELRPDHCRSCGLSLKDERAVPAGARQVLDIPPVKAVFTEYRAFAKTCGCGCRTIADFPQVANAPISYGENIEALTGYLHARQYLPFKRMAELFNDVFNVGISEGGIHRLLDRFAGRATPFYDMIGRRVAGAKVVGTDETGIKVNGDRHWFWTWQTPGLTYIAHCDNRGKAAIDAHFPNGFPNATLVHDGWRPQASTIAEHHQTCLPHLLRHLNYLGEKYGNAVWPVAFKKLLYDALEIKKRYDPRNEKYIRERTGTVLRLTGLLERPPDRELKELHTFYKRMCRERRYLFTFLFIKEVPPDNNASERAIRNVKVKQKISGQFKTQRTAQNFAKIRSIIDTTLKNGMNVLDALNLIAKLQPQIAD